MTNRYKEYSQQYDRIREQRVQLDEDYKDKKKGDLYLKRKMQLEDKARHLINKTKEIGTNGNICHIHGKRQRPSRKNPQVMVQESFNLYFVNITEEEASALVSLHVKNTVHYSIKFIRPGVIITS